MSEYRVVSFKKEIIKNIIFVVLAVILAITCSYLSVKYTLSKISIEQEGTVVVYKEKETNNAKITNTSISDVVSDIEDSVVEVYTEQVQYSTFYGSYISEGAGSGVIYSTDGYIVTNNHVIEGASEIKVRLHDGTEYKAKLIATDDICDLAIIKIDVNNLQPAILGNANNLKTGQTVIAIGNPLGTLGGTVTTGIISALSREVTIDNTKMTLLQTNAAINPGNSGGGLFDENGCLIGIVNAKSSGENVEGIGFAIPIDIVETICKDLIEKGYVEGRATINIDYTPIESYQAVWYYNLNDYGIYVRKVYNSNSELKENDLIVAINGERITSESGYLGILGQYTAGEEVEITVKRSRKEVTLEITLDQKK